MIVLLSMLMAFPTCGQAAVLVRIEHDTANASVTITSRGSLDLTGLGTPQIGGFEPIDMLIFPDQAYVPSGIPGFQSVDVYQNVFTNRVLSIGPGSRPSHWSQTTGGFFAINGGGDALLLPRGYASGEEILATPDISANPAGRLSPWE